MKIAILGAGNVGRALAAASVKAGHRVILSAADPENAKDAAKVTGADAAGSNVEAVEGADLVVLATPFDAVDGIVAELGGELDAAIVVDVTNRMSPDGIDGSSNAEHIHDLEPNARVVKAFNTVFASKQVEPVADDVQLDAFVAGDDADAKRRVMDLASSIGMRPIDAGPLVMARALEAMAILNIALNMNNEWSWQTGWKLHGPTG
jgi:8-hydroxy-5-deazaflavin:NADPH oxidoreductase